MWQERRDRERRERATAITINLKEAKNAAEIVREVAIKLSMKETVSPEEDATANVLWYERAPTVAEVKLMNECQRANMIPGMHDIAKKSSLAKALNRMRLLFPNDFAFYPQTWTLPNQARAATTTLASTPSPRLAQPVGRVAHL